MKAIKQIITTTIAIFACMSFATAGWLDNQSRYRPVLGKEKQEIRSGSVHWFRLVPSLHDDPRQGLFQELLYRTSLKKIHSCQN